MTKKFVRRIWSRYSRLGKRRKRKQRWKRPTGRDNKMRERRRGYPVRVEIGYKQDKKNRNKVEGKGLVLVRNVSELNKLNKNDVAVIAKIGKKKKIEIAKMAEEMKLQVYNLNTKKLLKNTGKKK